MSATKSIVLKVNDWATEAVRFTPPKVNDKQGKSVNIISTQTGRGLHIETPLMTTWGIADFVDKDTGVSDGKFSMSLTFPNGEYANANTEAFLAKLKSFESNILDEAVKNSTLWFGKQKSRELVEDSFYPILKYPKSPSPQNPNVKIVDHTKSPSISAKVPFYEKDNKWNVEIYDTNANLLFPCENEEMKPSDFVPRLSSVKCVLQCGGIWIGGKGWGITWKLVQAVVKPRENVSVYGRCHIQLTDDDKSEIETHDEQDVADVPAPVQSGHATVQSAPVPAPINTQVADSDDEGSKPEPVQSAPVPTPVAVEPVKKTVVKKVVKKAA